MRFEIAQVLFLLPVLLPVLLLMLLLVLLLLMLLLVLVLLLVLLLVVLLLLLLLLLVLMLLLSSKECRHRAVVQPPVHLVQVFAALRVALRTRLVAQPAIKADSTPDIDLLQLAAPTLRLCQSDHELALPVVQGRHIA